MLSSLKSDGQRSTECNSLAIIDNLIYKIGIRQSHPERISHAYLGLVTPGLPEPLGKRLPLPQTFSCLM